jgi:hypothetical protein
LKVEAETDTQKTFFLNRSENVNRPVFGSLVVSLCFGYEVIKQGKTDNVADVWLVWKSFFQSEDKKDTKIN